MLQTFTFPFAFRQKHYEPSPKRRWFLYVTPPCKCFSNPFLLFTISDCLKLQKCIPKVWLLSYDLYHRNFKKRDSKLALLAKTLFRDRGLLEAEEALWSHRVKLAAAVARLRIKNSALRLHDLLPKHLRNDVTMKNSLQSPVTCWVNIAKVK